MAKVICSARVSRWREDGGRTEEGGTDVKNTENDTHFHLERIRKDESVVGSVPGGVDTERVVNTGSDRLDDLSFAKDGGESELRRGDSEREGEDIVVHQSGVHGEELQTPVSTM